MAKHEKIKEHYHAIMCIEQRVNLLYSKIDDSINTIKSNKDQLKTEIEKSFVEHARNEIERLKLTIKKLTE